MKKKFLILVITIFFCLPGIANANGCGNCGGLVGGTTADGSSGPASSCDVHGRGGVACYNGLTNDSGYYNSAVRITFYYEKDNHYYKLGHSVDLFNNGFQKPKHISNPANSDVLRDRLNYNSSCTISSGKHIRNFGLLWYSDPSNRIIDWSTYVNNYTYYIVNGLGTAIYNQNLNDKLLKDDGNGNYSGWLYDYVFKYMMKGDYTTAANVFGAKKETLYNNLQNIYITAELLQYTYPSGSSWNYYGGVYVTVGEASETIILPWYDDRAYVSQYNLSSETKTIGKLVTKSCSVDKNTGICYEQAGSNPTVTKFGNRVASGVSWSFAINKPTTYCHRSWGMGIWYLPDCCPECTNSCIKACSELEQGSAARGSCAVAWCNANIPDDVKSKSKTEQDKWIDECIYGNEKTAPEDVCYRSTNEGCGNSASKCLESSKNSMSKSNKCDELSDDSTVTLSSNICLDDKETYKTDSVNYSAGGYTVASKKLSTTYYKIDCNETANLSNLPEKRKIQFNSAGVANLYVGYKMNYSKRCTLTWVPKKGNLYVPNTETIDNYSIKNGELVDLDKILKLDDDKIITKLRSDQRALAVRLEEVKKIIEKKEYVFETDEQYYKNLEKYLIEELKQIQDEKVIDVAKIRLQNVAVQETSLNTNKAFSNTVGIEVSVGSSTTKEEKLEPVYCTSKVFSDVSSKVDEYPKVCPDGTRYVDTITTVTTTTTEESVCDNNNQKGIIITTSDGLKTNYSKSIFYALPSSYIEGDTDETGKVHHDLKECEDDVKPYNGLCVRKENVHTFNQNIELDNYGVTPNSGSVPFTLKVKNYGSCGQFNYTLSCEGDTVIEEQDCDELCGPNLQCRAIYCPNDCPACPEVDVETSSIDHKCISTACMNTCKDNYSDKNSEGYIHCEADCCRMENADKVQCCLTECDKLYKNGYIDSDGLAACRKDCPPDLGDDYIYRTVDMDNPFPERDPGKNWIGKQRDLSKYITDADKYSTDNSSKNKKYYDETNGFNGKYEYKIQLDSSLIKAIRNSNEVSTTYQDYERSKSTSSSIGKNIASNQNGQVYCSHLLNDSGAILYEANQKDNNISGGMGCK